MSIRNVRVVLVAAVVAALLGGSVATAAKLITGKDIKNGSITASDIKKGSIGLNRLSKGTQALIRKAGAPGATGAAGKNGANGANGAPGAPGASFDPGAVSAQNAPAFGFTRWRDSDKDSSIGFASNTLVLASVGGKPIGVNLPIPGGTKVADLAALDYTVPAQAPGAALRVEIFVDGLGNSIPAKYTTLVYEPAGAGPFKSTTATTAAWWSTQDPDGLFTGFQNGGGRLTWTQVLAKLAAKTDAAIFNVSIGQGSSTSTDDKLYGVSSIDIQLGKADPKQSYKFVG